MIRTPAELAHASDWTDEEDERYYEAFTPTPSTFNATYSGIPVAFISEDGDLIALGHHDPARCLAAFNAHREISEATFGHVCPGWAVFRKPGPELAGTNWTWYPRPVPAGTAGAVPVMWLEI